MIGKRGKAGGVVRGGGWECVCMRFVCACAVRAWGLPGLCR